MTAYNPRLLTYLDARGEQQTMPEAQLPGLEGPVVILGDPGMGKTQLLKTLGARDGFVYMTARKFIRDQDPRGLGLSGQVLVIDALDEVASARDEDAVNQVLIQLAKAGSPRFILSCRGADWQGAVSRQDIGEDYQDPLVLTLAPVSRDDALFYLTDVLDEARAATVLGDLDARALQALYGNPLMLTLIGSVVHERGRLPDTRHELYAQSCELLCKEINPQRARSKLATMDLAAILDAAGATCAALLLTGSEAISLESPGQVMAGDLHIAEITRLPEAADIAMVLGSKLFKLEAEDRFGPIHRTIAEFIAARWLAGRLATVPAKRLMALLANNGGVPASLRGLHAWLADFSPEIAPQVIDTDAYGFLLYGDPTTLSDSGLRHLLAALKRLSVENPHFRDWSQQAVAGLARITVLDDLRILIFDKDTTFQLRMLLLDAIEGQEVVVPLEAGLRDMLLNDGKHRLSFAERRAAGDALVSAPQLNLDWPALSRTLQTRPGEDPRRLAVELMAKIGPALFAPEQIARAALAELNLLPSAPAKTGRTNTIGVLYGLAVKIPVDQIAAVLDQVVAIAPKAGVKREWDTRYALSEFIDTLVARLVAVMQPTPMQLLAWLRLVRRRDGHETERRKDISQTLAANDDLRRAMQRQVLLVDTDHQNLWGRAWRMGEIDRALVPTTADLVWLIDQAQLDPTDPVQLEKLCDLVRLANSQAGLAMEVLRAIAPIAAGNATFSAFLDQVRRRRIPEWERQDRARRRRERRLEAARWARHRANFSGREAGIAKGELNDVYAASQAYLGRYYDIDRKLPPPERVSTWLGDPLAKLMLEGFEATLHRQDLPSAASIAESYGQAKRWHYVLPMLAGLVERVRSGRGVSDLNDDVIIAARIALLHEHLEKDAGGEELQAALDAWITQHPGAVERVARLTIEPQIRHKRDHVSGLYQMMRAAKPQPLTTALAQEWLERFLDLDVSTEYELIGHLLRSGRWDAIRQVAARRRAAGYRDKEHERAWLAIGFVTDFDAHRSELDAAAADPKFLWFLRTWRGETRREGAAERPTPLPALMWIVETFRPRFKALYRQGSSSGDTNGFDATDFLQALIRAVASDTSDAGIAAMDALRDAPRDGYTDMIRNARAQQITARREADFTPPSFQDVRSVVTAGPPLTVSDLQAIVLDALDRGQAIITGDDLESVSMFYNHDEPRDENGCRDRLGILLRGLLPQSIDIIPERPAPGHTRADLALTLGRLHLPIEAKGQWHEKLWSAAQDQLDESYTRDWRAVGVGIYLVFWFGADVPGRCKFRGPPRPQRRPTTPRALQEALTARVPDHRRGDIAVVVLDVSRRAVPGDAPTASSNPAGAE